MKLILPEETHQHLFDIKTTLDAVEAELDNLPTGPIHGLVAAHHQALFDGYQALQSLIAIPHNVVARSGGTGKTDKPDVPSNP